jgi:hypothetical protein
VIRPIGRAALSLLVCTLGGCKARGEVLPPAPLTFPACFLLQYDEWGDPPRSDGGSMRGARAAVVMMLRDERQDTTIWWGRDTADRVAAWALSATDSVSYLGNWKRRGADSIAVLFPFSPGLFGQVGAFKSSGADLDGEISTFSDVIGVEPGRSHVVGRRIPCQMPRLLLPPREAEARPER